MSGAAVLVPPRQSVSSRLDVWQPPSRTGVNNGTPGRVSASLGMHGLPASTQFSLGVEMLKVDAKALHSRRAVSPILGPSPLFDALQPFQAFHSDSVSSGQSTPRYSHHVVSSGRGEGGGGGSASWAGGQATDRSSTCSFDDEEEMERHTTDKVQSLFSDVDEMLYERERRWGSPGLQSECSEWREAFPHLRVRGEQVLQSTDCGWQFTPGIEADTELAPSQAVKSQLGSWMSVSRCPVSIARSRSRDGEEVEEVLEAEGIVEDVIAIDRNTAAGDEDVGPLRHHGNRQSQQQRHFMPPITPQLCIKDNIQMALFDYLWSELPAALKTVIEDYRTEMANSDGCEDEESNSSQGGQGSDERGRPVVPTTLAFPSNDVIVHSLSRDVSNVSRFSIPVPRQRLLTTSRLATVSQQVTGGDSGTLFVAGKNLVTQHAERPVAQSNLSDVSSRREVPVLPHRPSSSAFPQKPSTESTTSLATGISGVAGTVGGRVLELGRFQSAHVRPSPLQTRLAPLTGANKTSSFLADSQLEMRGQALQLEHVASKTPVHNVQQRQRNGSLPPLASDTPGRSPAAFIKTRQKSQILASAVPLAPDGGNVGEKQQRRLTVDSPLYYQGESSPALVSVRRPNAMWAHGTTSHVITAVRHDHVKADRSYACLSSMSHMSVTGVMSPVMEASPRQQATRPDNKMAATYWARTQKSSHFK